jgi:ABC-type glycerol-3-phosphate transport system permease component
MSGAPPKPHRTSSRGSAERWVLVLGLGLISLSAIAPILFMAISAFRTPQEWAVAKLGLPSTWSLDAFERAWTGGNIGTTFVNSVIVTTATVVLSLVLATMAGYAFSKISWRGREWTYFLVLSWMAIPALLLMVPIYVQMVDLHLVNTYWSVVFLYTALNLPFNTFLMTAFFRAIPDELIEAAWLDGASVHQVFRKILVPLSTPALATLVIFNALYVWNEFVFALLLLQKDSVKTLTVGVIQMQGRFFADFPALLAGLLIATLPVIGVYLLFQRYLVRAIAAGALK